MGSLLFTWRCAWRAGFPLGLYLFTGPYQTCGYTLVYRIQAVSSACTLPLGLLWRVFTRRVYEASPHCTYSPLCNGFKDPGGLRTDICKVVIGTENVLKSPIFREYLCKIT